MSVTLNLYQLKQLVEHIEAGDADDSVEVTVQRFYAERVSNEGEPMPPGVYFWDSEYPEEGVTYLPAEREKGAG